MTLDPSRIDEPADPSTVTPEPEGSRWGRAHHILLAFVALGLLVWLGSGFYVIGANEVGIVERLGEYVSLNGSGPGYGLPWPIDIVHKVPISKKRTIEINEFSNIADPGVEEFKRDILNDPNNRFNPAQLNAIYNPYVVTGDKNMLNASVIVNYQIDDARKYLLAVGGTSITAPEDIDPEEALKPFLQQTVARVLNRTMATLHVDDALTDHQDVLVRLVTEGLREECKSLNLGIYIVGITIHVTWPPSVDFAFSLAKNAKQRKQQLIEQAGGDAATKIAIAKGEAARIMAEATGYQKSVVNAAEGDRTNFVVLRDQYERADNVTTQTLFSDAVTTILGNAGRTYVVQKGQRVILSLPDDKSTPAPAAGQPDQGK